MKTVVDAVRHFKGVWPDKTKTKIIENIKEFKGSRFNIGELVVLADNDLAIDDEYWEIVCTYFEFIEEVGRIINNEYTDIEALAKKLDKDWYDYKNYMMIKNPSPDTHCEYLDNDKWIKCYFVGIIYGDHVIYIDDGTSYGMSQDYFDGNFTFRPLDWNKNKARDEWVRTAVNLIPSEVHSQEQYDSRLNLAGIFYDGWKSGELKHP